jgi:hypothetical protein
MNQKYPYIAIIEDFYKTSKGNYLCREKGKDLSTHPYDWPIFVPEQHAKEISVFPIHGILTKEKNNAFVNGERITCRLLSYDVEKLKGMLNLDTLLEEGAKKALLQDLIKLL